MKLDQHIKEKKTVRCKYSIGLTTGNNKLKY